MGTLARVGSLAHRRGIVGPALIAAAALVVALVPALTRSAEPAGAQVQRTVTFSVATKGAVAADVEAFAASALATLNDPRGWSLGGSVRFARVPSGGDFTLWLAEASTVPSFSSICSSSWSCRVGRNVIINDLRWRTATDAWSGGGGSLRDYQHYVVNHETGHWLGLGHPGCGGAGQASPVMAQQSITLGGCRPNAWPLPWERSQVAGNLGVSIITPGVPVGALELAAASGPHRVRVVGWAADVDAGTSPIGVHVYVAGRGYNLGPVAGTRTDVAAALPWAGPSHGFDRTLTGVPAGTHQACAYAIGVGSGGNALLGCRAVTVVDDLQGNLELARWAVAPGAVRVGGWALDLDTTMPTDVHVYLAGAGFNLGPATRSRPDLAGFGVGTGHGFDRVLTGIPPGTHQVCAYVIDTGGGPASLAACRTVHVPAVPVGALDLVAPVADGRARAAGWAFDPEVTGPIDVHVYVRGTDGSVAGTNLGPADRPRPDVGRAYPAYGPDHGFDGDVAVPGGLVGACAYGIGVGVGGHALLGCATP